MYDENFAKIYNKDWAWFSENMANNVLNLNIKRNSILDLGCGTGNFLQILEKHFKICIGIDLSKDMIDIAKQNCKKANLFVGNILDFQFDQKFNLITCNYDMINHLNTLEEYIKVFKNVYKHLEKGGLFLFDFNTKEYLNNLTTQPKSWENDVTIKMAQDTFIDENHAKFSIKVYDKKNNLLASIEEVESFYDYKTIELALREAGFNNIIFCNKDLQATQNLAAQRLFVMCRK